MSEANRGAWVGVRPTTPAANPIPVTLQSAAGVAERGDVPILKGRIFNTAVVAATDFFAADLSPTNSPTDFRIYVALDTAGVLSVRRTSGGVTVAEQLNAGGNLNANASYMFNILVHSSDTINLRFSVNATILYCLIIEIPGAVS